MLKPIAIVDYFYKIRADQIPMPISPLLVCLTRWSTWISPFSKVEQGVICNYPYKYFNLDIEDNQKNLLIKNGGRYYEI